MIIVYVIYYFASILKKSWNFYGRLYGQRLKIGGQRFKSVLKTTGIENPSIPQFRKSRITALRIILPELNPPIKKANKNVLKPQVEKGCEKDDGKGNGKARDRSNFSNRLRHSDPVLQKQINNIKVNYLQPTHIIKKCIPARTPLTQRKIRQRTC